LDQSVGVSWEIKDEYKVNGRHYAKTSEAWLKLFDNEKKKLLKIYQEVYKGEDDGKIWFNRWRIFFITLAEFFGFREGTEWFVSHYYLKPRVHDV
jgi:cyclopropane-fatty-acyl-phospholipid synthase